MKCLGIPNSRHFNEITSIADAKASNLIYLLIVYDKLKKHTKSEGTVDTIAEYEDEMGNVFNKKTFEGLLLLLMCFYLDLKRQGLL